MAKNEPDAAPAPITTAAATVITADARPAVAASAITNPDATVAKAVRDEAATSPTTTAPQVSLRSLSVFHVTANGAAGGRTVTPGDVFEVTTSYGDDLVRQGLAEHHEAAPEPTEA